jgi:hypothetical protein
MSAFISDKSLMAIVGFMRDACLTHDEIDALEECIRGLEGNHIVDANKMVETPKRSLAADAIERQGMTPNPSNCEVTAISGRRFESDIDEAKPETPEEAAERWAADYWDEEGNEFNELMRACGKAGWLAALRWAEEKNRS